MRLKKTLSALWRGLRQASGDDAYERYMAHLRRHHPDTPALDRKAFYAQELARKWESIRRCC